MTSRPTEQKERAVERIFEDRVPEAAARQMACVLAWIAECQLATLEMLGARKRTAKHELARQEEICDTLITHIADLKIDPRGFYGRDCPRLAARLRRRIAPAARLARAGVVG